MLSENVFGIVKLYQTSCTLTGCLLTRAVNKRGIIACLQGCPVAGGRCPFKMRDGPNLLNFTNPFSIFYAIILVARAWQPTATYVTQALGREDLLCLAVKQCVTGVVLSTGLQRVKANVFAPYIAIIASFVSICQAL